VRYILEGSVRRLSNQIRVNAQLIDAQTDTHLWAERFDSFVEDLFVLQDEITNWIARALKPLRLPQGPVERGRFRAFAGALVAADTVIRAGPDSRSFSLPRVLSTG
jgi:adenylate cyclase